ncbi:MAG: ATP-dependent helicase [Sulfobacillus acidophilus]|uniref:ATP-dependent helicase n=1 Tax=Sulfobacillus acidophilus TaxID=53633 RepID=A0A2T2WKR4_9FIRM|nr:MAG: ATP-dependent helicase [Sulfobacillus acidophilus]
MAEPSALALARTLKAWDQLQPQLQNGLDIHAYQIESILKIVNQLEGRAILADEVGLGKTIEAGLVTAELTARGLVDNVLILVPAGLQSQWVHELNQKFGWTAQKGAKDRGWLWVLSIDSAKRPPLLHQLQHVQWDLVIVDEAHHLKNTRTQNYQLLAGLKCRYLLLLTATPMENQLTELYTLVNLVKPGLFGPYLRFYRQFILDKRTPRNAAELRRLLAQVMVRNRRQTVGLKSPGREVTLVPLKLNEKEQALYEALSTSLKTEYRHRVRTEQTVLPLLVLQRELCSSPRALVPTLRNSQWIGDSLAYLVKLAESIAVTSKMRAVLELARHVQDRILIFTEYRGTQDALVEFLQKNGYEAQAFHGGLKGGVRDQLVDWFQADKRVLVSTEAGGQGINLQFCHVVVNFDLPWNPMRIEQRIGRVHRIGQTKPVQIYNLFAVDTVEADILRLLHEKIDLFRTVVGELDVILRHLERRGSLEKRLIDIFFWEDDHDNMMRRLDQLGDEFLAARRRLQWPDAPSLSPEATGERA